MALANSSLCMNSSHAFCWFSIILIEETLPDPAAARWSCPATTWREANKERWRLFERR
jgi:hypothetical protein